MFSIVMMLALNDVLENPACHRGGRGGCGGGHHSSCGSSSGSSCGYSGGCGSCGGYSGGCGSCGGYASYGSYGGCGSCGGGGYAAPAYGHGGCSTCYADGTCTGGTYLAMATPVTAPATLAVKLPEDATLVVDETTTKSTSGERLFITPALESGKTYTYTLKATVVRDGRSVSIEEKVTVRAGEQSSVTLSVPSSAPSVASR